MFCSPLFLFRVAGGYLQIQIQHAGIASMTVAYARQPANNAHRSAGMPTAATVSAIIVIQAAAVIKWVFFMFCSPLFRVERLTGAHFLPVNQSTGNNN